MEKEQVTGKVDQLKGKVKQGVGKATNNPRLHDEGVVDEVKGKVKQTVGNVKQAKKVPTRLLVPISTTNRYRLQGAAVSNAYEVGKL